MYTIAQLKQQLRSGDHAWPGGYPLYFVADDGATLSFASVRENFRQVIESMRDRLRDGWGVIGCEVNWEDPELYCDNSGERIPSAYAEPETL